MKTIDYILEYITDGNIAEALQMIESFGDVLTAEEADAIMDAAGLIDPTFSRDGAEIRDTLRNVTDLTIA